MTKPTLQDWSERRSRGWSSPLAVGANAGLVLLILTGLPVFLAPFSVFNQHAVIVHTLAGIAWTIPFLVYLVWHIRVWWDAPLTHAKFTGWVSGGMALVCTASGVVLTLEAQFGTRIVEAWRLTHIVSTFGTLLFLVPHLVAVLAAQMRQRTTPEGAAVVARASRHGLFALSINLAGLAIVCALCLSVRPVTFDNRFPDGYEQDPYGQAGPFAPSLARTATGGALDAASLSGSQDCGSADCHPQIYAEWQPSAHRYASMDKAFQGIQSIMAAQNGPASTRYCGGCHDPISLFSGTKNIGVEELTSLHGYQEGVSCLVCHAIEQTDVKGNANYVVHQPERYVFELAPGPVARELSQFLIRAYPQHHVESLSRRMFKTPEFCAACHKQFIDKEVNRVGWVQLQNQYDNWRASRWHDESDPRRTIECRECHMPLVESRDPASGDQADWNRSRGDGKHRSHAFLGANQFIPVLQDLPGGREHAANVERWLRGEFDVPEIADRWRTGPAVPIEVDAPAEVAAGDTVALRVHVTNNKVGHDFPTGPLDIIQAWIEVTVTDDAGRVVFHTGSRDERAVIETGTFMFKAEPVDRYGNLIDRHNLWEMVGVRFRRSLFPGAEEVASYEFGCPGSQGADMQDLPQSRSEALTVPTDASGTLHVRTELNYRKVDQYMLDTLFGKDSGVTSPVTLVSSDETTIRVLPRRSGRPGDVPVSIPVDVPGGVPGGVPDGTTDGTSGGGGR